MAKALGRNDEEKALYEYNARNQVRMMVTYIFFHLIILIVNLIPDNFMGTERRDFGLCRKAMVGPF